MFTIDGSRGEGGGQILRSALTLSMITGEPFRIEKLRAGRSKPGLLRQHLTCVNAAREIASAKVTGGELNSQTLTFEPGPIKAGAYTFEIDSAGSTGLVFQTVCAALLQADGASTVTFGGGTHNPAAPTYDYLDRVYLPLVRRMGASVVTRLERHGFYPAGGGRWQADIAPATLSPLHIEQRGEVTRRRIIADVVNMDDPIAAREAGAAAAALSWPPETIQANTVKADGPGNVLAIEITAGDMTELFTAFGERGASAEAVAAAAVAEAQAYLAAGVPVGPHLADQLLLPLALAKGGAFLTTTPTPHTQSNIEVIEKFLPVEFEVSEAGAGRWRIAVSA